MTTRLPGASDDFTDGLSFRPFSMAFLASKPAASMTVGLEVLVQLVMAAMSTEPCPIFEPLTSALTEAKSSAFLPKPFSVTGLLKEPTKLDLRFCSSIRSCGRFGPATLGTTLERSSSTTCEYSI